MHLVEPFRNSPLGQWLDVSLDPEVLPVIARLVALQEVILSLLNLNTIQFTSTVITLLQPQLQVGNIPYTVHKTIAASKLYIVHKHRGNIAAIAANKDGAIYAIQFTRTLLRPQLQVTVADPEILEWG